MEKLSARVRQRAPLGSLSRWRERARLKHGRNRRFSLIILAGAAAFVATDIAWAQSPAPDEAGAQAPESAPKRTDRRIGKVHDKVHDKIRAQITRDTEARLTATGPYADYLAVKKTLEDAGFTYEVAATAMAQWGKPRGGPGAFQAILNPNANWDVFDSALIGRGSIQISYNYNNYFYNQTGKSLSSTLDILSSVNDTPSDGYSFTQLTYTHEFPGNWLQITGGQFQVSNFDNNQYAGNQQTGFVNFALSQNASQAYISTSVGAYVQLNPTRTLSFAAGLQDANNTGGHIIQTTTIGQGPSTWFVYGQWTPAFPGLGSAQYSLLYYNQPKIEAQPGIPSHAAGQGWSFNAVQNLNATWGLFARANTASGSHPTIETSIAGGVIYNNPFGLGARDQIGLGLAWNKTNLAAFSNQSVRPSETVAEAYWNLFVTPFLMMGPSVQVVFNPALHPESDAAGILTLRATGLF